MTHRDLRPIPLADALDVRAKRRVMTMAVGQWDALLSAAYDNGWVLLELDDDEVPVRAYQRDGTDAGIPYRRDGPLG
jgi:hypothetical protein